LLIFNVLRSYNYLVPMEVLGACLDIARSPCESPFVIPLHKKGSKAEANIRGISKLRAIPMFFENIFTSHFQNRCRSGISPCQHVLNIHRLW